MSISKQLTFLAFLFLSTNLQAQNFDIGHTSVTIFDSARSRNIGTEIYYPAATAGEDMPVASGNFPVLVFGHGFLMSWDAYENFWTRLVPDGYIICFPTTESGVTPNHGDLGLDIRFIAKQMLKENEDTASLFLGAIAPQIAAMGHSMGGGASFLAAEGDRTISALINFAAAETNPSAIAAATDISVPALIFAGDDDCVTPPGDHQNPMYDSLASACKTLLSIKDGGHCYFAENNFGCTLGETFCNPSLNITREAQFDVTFDFLKLWLDYALKGNAQAFTEFNDSLTTSSRIDFSQSCTSTAVGQSLKENEIKLFPNPALDQLNVLLPEQNPQAQLMIYDVFGKLILQREVNKREIQLSISALKAGTYTLVFIGDRNTFFRNFLKVDEE